MPNKFTSSALGALALICHLGSTALAQDYPNRPVTLVVPYPAGGGADIVARMLADTMKATLGQSVTVVNRPGGQGTVGTADVVRSAPDGYNLVLSAVATLTVQPHRQDLPYDTPDDYDPIIRVAGFPMVLAVLSSAPWKSGMELMDYVRANPDRLRVGTPGNGSMGHLIVASVNSKAGVKLAHVPFASSGDSIPSMMGGNIDAIVADTPEVLPLAKTKTVTILATFADKRIADFPDAPTFKELGTNVSMGVYYTLVAPKGMPADVKGKLFQAAKAAIESPAFGSRAKDRGYNLEVKDSEDFRKDLWVAYRTNGVLVKELGMGKK